MVLLNLSFRLASDMIFQNYAKYHLTLSDSKSLRDIQHEPDESTFKRQMKQQVSSSLAQQALSLFSGSLLNCTTAIDKNSQPIYTY